MDFILSKEEARVLGALIEKSMTTPDYYPMTINGLMNACNQKSNRDPVMNLDEETIRENLESLRYDRYLVYQADTAGGRVPKYGHRLQERFGMDNDQCALLCVLLLRGPQTAGELKTRTHRLFDFSSLEHVEQILQELVDREDGPYVAKLARRPGQKEQRYHELMSNAEESIAASEEQADPESCPQEERRESKVSQLEKQVEELTRCVDALREELDAFKQQFS